MKTITLTTDWGLKDHYLANVKGYLYSQISDVSVIDISHLVSKFNIVEGAFILKNSYYTFPKGTIHIISIKDQWTEKNPHLLLKYNEHYFIGTDTGIFSLILDGDKPELIIELDIIQETECFTFPAKDVFAKVACQILNGKDIKSMGQVKENILECYLPKPTIHEDCIIGNIIYFDDFQNAITNIKEDLFKKVIGNKKFTIYLSRMDGITKISDSYNDVDPDVEVAVFSSTGHLEIAMNNSTAKSLLGLDTSTSIRIEF